jgi:hypothetical protein
MAMAVQLVAMLMQRLGSILIYQFVYTQWIVVEGH